MAQMMVLGSANAVPDVGQENTYLLACTSERSVLIDCGNNPVPLLRKMNINLDQLSDLILTHFHPDHVASAPLLLMDMWLLGRTAPLRILGLKDVIDRMEAMMELYDWRSWPRFYPVIYERIPAEEMSLVLDYADMRMYGSPVEHMIPTLGLRIEFPAPKRVIAYSCDTEPCQQVVRLGKDADILLHESAGASYGHSSPAQAAGIAVEAGARALCLIHYPTDSNPDELVKEAQRVFPGRVFAARDQMDLNID
jgi:ribonuclease Z